MSYVLHLLPRPRLRKNFEKCFSFSKSKWKLQCTPNAMLADLKKTVLELEWVTAHSCEQTITVGYGMGIYCIMRAMGISHWMSKWSCNLLQKNQFLDACFCWFSMWSWDDEPTKLPAWGQIKLLQDWSFGKHANDPICKDSIMFQNYCDGSKSRALLPVRAFAISTYICINKWCTQVALSTRWPSYPVSIWASFTIKDFWLTCQVVSSCKHTSTT